MMLLVISGLASAAATARPVSAPSTQFCRADATIIPPRPAFATPEDDSVHLYADDAFLQEHQGIATLTGNVFALRQRQLVQANSVVYRRDQALAQADNEQIEANSQFTYWDDRLVIRGDKLRLLGQNKGEMENVSYWLLQQRGRGVANKVFQDSETQMRLEEGFYTTCDPQSEAWRLEAAYTEIDNVTEEGKSHHVWVKFFGIPLFYSPYVSFPLNDKRKSGFLAPMIGTSNDIGTEISIPYYLNLDPSYDLTITPRLMSRRGVMLGGDFRYLFDHSEGRIEAEYLANDSATGEQRYSVALSHRAELSSRWFTDLVYARVSDERYFNDFGSNLALASLTHLEQRIDMLYRGDGWWGMGRLQAYQTLDRNPLSRPYQRLPQIVLNSALPERNQQLNVSGQVEMVRFERDWSDVTDTNITEHTPNPTGARLDAKVTVNYPIRQAGWFFIPQLSGRYTQYQLEDWEDSIAASDYESRYQTTLSNSPKRTLFTASVDTGVILERPLTLFDYALTQTLEPRLYYRYTPYEDQRDLPVFDTAEYDLSFAQLFRDNRFSGADRVDDAHQITAALTTRFLNDKSGIEHLRFSIGQIYYFRDRQVFLPDSSQLDTLEDSSSSVIAEIASQFARDWQASATLQWSPHRDSIEYTVLRLRYRHNEQQLANLAYRYREDQLEQVDITGYLPLSSRWKLLGRWNYSIKDKKELEIFAGLEYQSCCWAARGVVRRYLNSLEGDYLNGFFFQLELKGLGSFGKKADSFLEERISGFSDNF